MLAWSDEEARRYVEKYGSEGEDLALRVYTTRLLGRQSSLVLHGGGNTSVKTVGRDELGRELPVLCVKGSGWDMGVIEPTGLPAVQLEGLREFRSLEKMSDEAMVNGFRRLLLDASAPTPSVETLLHAFLPPKFIDHTHADAVVAILDQPDATERCREIFGDKLSVVPYIMAGFQLAKKAAEIYEANPNVEGLLLLNHGIFTFGENARQAYERMIDAVENAESYIAARRKPVQFDVSRQEIDRAALLGSIRGAFCGSAHSLGRVILEVRDDEPIMAFLQRSDLMDIAQRGPVTPDHIIRTKRVPLILENPPLTDPAAFEARFNEALSAYENDYIQYFQRNQSAKGTNWTQLNPQPPVCLIPGLGLVTIGRTEKEARIAGDVYEHTVQVISDAEAIGKFVPLSEGDLFDMEYWSLEQAKLGKKKPPMLAGHVCLVTGATGGIGGAITHAFAAEGCNLVITDLDAERLEARAVELAGRYGVKVVPIPCNMVSEESVNLMVSRAREAFGGLDVVVSNAGKVFMGGMEESTGGLNDSLAINLLSHQYLAAAAYKAMAHQGVGGCLLFNASKSTFNPGPDYGAYSVAKAALVALMKQYAVEGGKLGIRSLAINADRIRTPLFDAEVIAARARARGLEPDHYFKSNLLGREVLAEDVARAFLHLYLSEKSTGAVFPVDGGNIAAAPR